MATAKQPLGAPGALPTPESVATFTYGQMVAAQCAVNDHLNAAAGVNFTDAFCALQPLHWALVDRLEALAEEDPRVVTWVAAAEGRRHPGRRQDGDLDAAESALAGSAIRAVMYLKTEGGCGRRGPFAALTHTQSKEKHMTNQTSTPNKQRTAIT